MTLVTVGETALRFSPPAGHRFETADEVTLQTDGISSTAAATAHRLGGDAVWVSKLPDTPLGRRVVAALHEHGLETDVVWADPGDGRQGLSFYEAGAAPREDRLLQDRTGAAMATLTPGELPMDRLQAADVLFVAGSMAALSETAADTAGAVLRAMPGTTALDLDFYPGLWTAERAFETLSDLFDAVDVLFARERQVEAVFDTTARPRELVHAIAADHGFETVVLTRDDHDVVAFHDNVIHEHDAIETETVDVTGQHAALVGAVLERLVGGAPLDEALSYGVAAAALTRTMPGPLTPLERAEVERLVDAQSDGRP
ncbi:PfkB family carbohydrate kinase [Halomicroarcula sp. GCM10025324]|jgi:2-dehydro-3-deoxygluconokinase|uniref:PfkB family carbohydrate kinase n=1 Tax=Haloarcula TaxID=2237 RepID=UPI0023E76013|nr:PfkB family carbohydrate kinase [Halomicroarcula sp. ZS-22-S1]